jgi:hypothetical protein
MASRNVKPAWRPNADLEFVISFLRISGREHGARPSLQCFVQSRPERAIVWDQ